MGQNYRQELFKVYKPARISVLPCNFILLLLSHQQNMVSDLSLQLHLNCRMAYLYTLRTFKPLLNSNHS